jgi:hypothetical protein
LLGTAQGSLRTHRPRGRFTTVYLIRLIDRRPSTSDAAAPAPGGSAACPASAARSPARLPSRIPETIASGTPFPNRDLIVFVTAGVIAVPLTQGPAATSRRASGPSASRPVRRAGTPTRRDARDRGGARCPPGAGRRAGTDPEALDRLRHDPHYIQLRLALLGRKRATVVGLHDPVRIDDIVLRQVQSRLDVEDVRLSRRAVAD